MKENWLWDRRIGLSCAKKILRQPNHKKFTLLASLLFARNNNPKKVFKEYIDPLLFCKCWAPIKKRMRKDKWNEPRIIFWQVIYERLLDKYRSRGVSFRKEAPQPLAAICKMLGKQIRDIRKKQGLSQKKLAEKMAVSQQLISRIEKGGENISLITLKNISDALGKKVAINLI